MDTYTAWDTVGEVKVACLGRTYDLHPLSEQALLGLIKNELTWQAFARYFTLPQSDNLVALECIFNWLTTGA